MAEPSASARASLATKQSSGGGKLALIEALRGIAATAVVLYHTARHVDSAQGAHLLRQMFQFGHAGVDLFFVLSGFIILFVHYDDIGRPSRLAHYLGRRFTRVMPTYWVALAITIALSIAGGRALPSLLNVTWSGLLLPSFDEPLLGVAWTLQAEFVFYAFFCVLILNRAIGILAFAAWLGFVTLVSVGLMSVHIPPALGAAYIFQFFFGMSAAFILKNYCVAKPGAIMAIGATLFACGAVAENFSILNGYGDLARFVYGIPAMLLVLGGAAIGQQSSKTKIPAPLSTLGHASYSIYLFQFIFIGITWKVMTVLGIEKWLSPIATFLILGVIAVAGGIGASKTIEYPLMRVVRGQQERKPVIQAA